MATKPCSLHHTYFPQENPLVDITLFGKKKSNADGLLDHCKECKKKVNARPTGNPARYAGINPATGKFLEYVGQMNPEHTAFRFKHDICDALGIPFEFGTIPTGLKLRSTEPIFENVSA